MGKALTPTTIEVLTDARDRLTDETWSRRMIAEDAAGLPVDAEDDDAVRWCAWGSVLKSVHDFEDENHNWETLVSDADFFLREAIERGDWDWANEDMYGGYTPDIEEVNDRLVDDVDDVRDVFTKAISIAVGDTE